MAATLAPPEEAALPCPMCDYDLRGQVEQRCPECGYRFTWEELRDPARRLHPYLFEQHPERNLRSFLQTVAGGLRPGRFWRALLPVQPSRPRRLWAYFALVWLLSLVPAVVVTGIAVAREMQEARNQRARTLIFLASPQGQAILRQPSFGGMTPQQVLDREFPLPSIPRLLAPMLRREEVAVIPFVSAAVLVLTLGTILALMVFRISMRRARVRPVHAVRCVIYSADVFLWAALAFAALFAGLAIRQVQTPFHLLFDDTWATVIAGLLGLTYLAFAWRLMQSFRLYLRFNHAIATVVATQMIAWLLLANVAQAFVMLFD